MRNFIGSLVMVSCMVFAAQSAHAAGASDWKPLNDRVIKLFNEGKFDIVITDLIMPNVEGIETIIKLKKRHPAVNIIAVSGGGRISAVDHLSLAEKFDVNKTLTKPFRKDDLLKAVDEILGI